jgi:catechol 2,3-dioxygenase-like lactoylglutathione lyase family enzyme
MHKELKRLLEPMDILDGQVFHIGLAVPDLRQATDLLGAALRLDWTATKRFDVRLETPSGTTTTPLEAIYSRQGPPYFEVICAPPGSFFAADQGPRLHHAGVVVDDPRAEAERLEKLGMRIAGASERVTFVTNELGFTLELMVPDIRNTLTEWFALPA